MMSIRELLPSVRKAGQLASEKQKNLSELHEERKSDDTLVTDVDREIESKIVEAVKKTYPNSNILGEELGHISSGEDGYTFVIDPIDGTDAFRQGLPGWAISVGLLNATAVPVAGIVYAPRMRMLLYSDLNAQSPSVEGYLSRTRKDVKPAHNQSNLMVSSRIHKQVDISRFRGKIRSLGSAAIHLCSPIVYKNVIGAVEKRGQYAWDIAGAHAILRSCGYVTEYLSGDEVDYKKISDGTETPDVLLAGPSRTVDYLREVLKTKTPNR